jgi:hypothetical protein
MYHKFDVTENLFLHSALFNETEHSLSLEAAVWNGWSTCEGSVALAFGDKHHTTEHRRRMIASTWSWLAGSAERHL